MKVEQQEELPDFNDELQDDEGFHKETSEAALALKAVANAIGEDPTTDTEAHPQEKVDNSPKEQDDNEAHEKDIADNSHQDHEMAAEAPKPDEAQVETKLPHHLWKKMPDDPNLCTTCYIFGYSRPDDRMCPGCQVNAL